MFQYFFNKLEPSGRFGKSESSGRTLTPQTAGESKSTHSAELSVCTSKLSSRATRSNTVSKIPTLYTESVKIPLLTNLWWMCWLLNLNTDYEANYISAIYAHWLSIPDQLFTLQSIETWWYQLIINVPEDIIIITNNFNLTCTKELKWEWYLHPLWTHLVFVYDIVTSILIWFTSGN